MAFIAICLLLLIVYNTGLVMGLVIRIIKLLFGENPLSRLFSIIGGIAALGLYGYWTIYKTAEYWTSTSDDNISPAPMIILLAFPWVLIALNYIMNGSGNDSGGSQ